ncbi:unnamed protein product [Larinioides sclopetarius]|uniref:Uncharacterized protein n=1 Tax=Larinioides sclopetarius TaxID=280406 RepID=A0AAV1YVI5_9ARAC
MGDDYDAYFIQNISLERDASLQLCYLENLEPTIKIRRHPCKVWHFQSRQFEIVQKLSSSVYVERSHLPPYLSLLRIPKNTQVHSIFSTGSVNIEVVDPAYPISTPSIAKTEHRLNDTVPQAINHPLQRQNTASMTLCLKPFTIHFKDRTPPQ